MLVLGIESSCDETAAAVVAGPRPDLRVLSDVVSSQTAVHREYGGVVPELASRHHLVNLVPVLEEALGRAGVRFGDLDGLAVTRGPGLAGALLVGVCAAKSIAWARGLPLAGVSHIEAHIHSATIENDVSWPHLALVVSGGHTHLFHAEAPGRFRLLAKTRDDAAGEAFDKAAKLLGLGYPGGPVIDRIARGFDGVPEPFPKVRMSDGSLDFSFSGLKSALLRRVESGRVAPIGPAEDPSDRPDIGALVSGFQSAVVEVLVETVFEAAALGAVTGISVTGGVSANSLLRERMREEGARRGLPVWIPSIRLTTDNAVMVASLGIEKHLAGEALAPAEALSMRSDPGLAIGLGAAR